MDSFSRDPVPAEGGTRGASQRSRGRDSLFLMARLRFVDEQEGRDVRVRNLSEGGLMAECTRVADAGTPVMLEVRGIGEVSGKIAWCTEGRIGIALDTPIDPKKARKPVGAGTTTPDYAKPIGR